MLALRLDPTRMQLIYGFVDTYLRLIPSCVLSCHSERSVKRSYSEERALESGQMLRVIPFHCILLSMTDSTLNCNLVLIPKNKRFFKLRLT